jgi:hypothetical protein
MSGIRGVARRMRLFRSILALGYALAVVLAQGAHDHEQDRDDVPRALAGCSDPQPHFAGHADAKDLSQFPDHCPACQVRAQHHGWTGARPFALASLAGQLCELSARVTCEFPSGPVSVRAPPRA